MSDFVYDDISILEERQEDLLKEWESRPNNPPSLKESVGIAFPDIEEKFQDGRSKYGKCVKAFLATQDMKAKPSHEYQGRDDVSLSDEMKEYINNNGHAMSDLDVTRIIFDDHTLTNLHKETRLVSEYRQGQGIEQSLVAASHTNDVPDQVEYKPPRTINLIISRVNKYVLDGINKDKFTARQRKEMESLIGYLHTYRFLHHINNFDSQVDRDLFESSFIRYTHDKSDLTQEEVDQYIVLSTEVVIASNIQRRVEHLQGLLDDAANDTDGRRISMSLVEAIGKAQNDYHQSVGRQNKLLNDLKEKRSDRLKNQIKENASIINLVQMWKEEESRQKLIKLAELRKQVVKEEIENLSSMDEVKARIMGISEDEVLEG
tara:strand:+ start:201 stop:1325 length:1125 start_codon:yes stop_codon:yes gene_type:complete